MAQDQKSKDELLAVKSDCLMTIKQPQEAAIEQSS
jgi:hypothetical protein